MKPILYTPEEIQFSTNGIGVMADAISCIVSEALNGEYELEMEYPVTGLHYDGIAERTVIMAKPNPYTEAQPFRVYNIIHTINGIATVRARHISYDLSGIVVDPFTAESAPQAMSLIKSASVNENPFEFETDKSTAAKMTVAVPKGVRSLLGGMEGSVLDTYGGEYEYDRFKVILHNRRGADRGVVIRYGKNLTDYRQERNCANVYTAVYPYWKAADGSLTRLDEKIVEVEGSFTHSKIFPLDVTSAFETEPSQEQMFSYTKSYISSNQIGVPDINWEITLVALDKTEEYKDSAILERIWLGDSIGVIFPKLGVNATARCIKATYNVLKDRYEKVELGSVRANLADTIVKQNKEIEKKPSVSLVEQITAALTVAITGAKGGAVRMLDTNGDGMPDTLYIADNPDPALAVKVWRFNYEGWAASKNGYYGPFVMGATLDEGILAEAITAARLVAGTIQSADGGKTLFIDLDNGIFRAKGGTLSYTAMAYLDPGEEEIITLRNHILHNPDLPEDQIPLYDINGDGDADITDMLQIRSIMLGKLSFADCPGAIMSEVTVTIDPSDSEKAIKITGTNQWGRDVEIYYGVNGTNARAAKSDFSVSGKLNVGGATTLNGPLIGYTGILYDTPPSVDELEENQIILVKMPTATTEETADG